MVYQEALTLIFQEEDLQILDKNQDQDQFRNSAHNQLNSDLSRLNLVVNHRLALNHHLALNQDQDQVFHHLFPLLLISVNSLQLLN